jgi:hypothetical protein
LSNFAQAASPKSVRGSRSPGGGAKSDARPGRAEEARRILAELEATHTSAEDSAQPVFWTLVALGEADRTFGVLERDFANRSVCFYLFDLRNHWFLEPLRHDRRLRALPSAAGAPLAGESQ